MKSSGLLAVLLVSRPIARSCDPLGPRTPASSLMIGPTGLEKKKIVRAGKAQHEEDWASEAPP